MATRLEFQGHLESLLGTREVYFQGPTNTQMEYPAIVYELDDLPVEHADGKPYTVRKKYNVQYITRNPDDPFVYELAGQERCSFDRHFVADRLHHYTFNIFF